jgi:PAS domain S-box-containing protein/putative nucleotidyltransferase with HDIG domain
MTRAEFVYLLPYLGALILSIALLVIIRNKHEASGSTAFFYYILGQNLYLLGFIFELITPTLKQKMFWESTQWIASCIPVIAFPVFASEYAGFRLKYRRSLFAASFVTPVIFSMLVATDAVHHLIYHNSRLELSNPFHVLAYDYSPIMIGFSVYVYLVVAISCVMLFTQMKRPRNLYSLQTVLIIIGAMIPLVGSFLSLTNTQPHKGYTLVATTIGNLIIAWGIYRFHLFEVEPIARERVFEAMVEPLVILDNKNIVVDINSSMLVLLGKPERDVVGRPARDVFDDFPIPIKTYTSVTYARAEAEFKLGGKSVHYELTVWPLYNTRKELTGRIYISHDITALKELENELRKLNSELEDRVQMRTRELAEAYESMLEGLARALELRDKETEGHSRRVTESALKIAQKMRISGEALEDIRSGAILHDIGKISIPDEILHKPGKLTPEERLIVEQHPETAFKLLSRIPFLSKAIEIPYCHHEKWDGTGYPRKLAGEEIPLSARIFAVADVWDALSNDRSYNKAWPRQQIIDYFIEQSGKHFDPVITKLFLSMVEKGEI